VAEIIGGIGTSHVPAVGAAFDKGKTEEPYWAPYFSKLGPARAWMEEMKPDVCIIVYNDHASAFSLEMIPTFAMGMAEQYPIADEGFGPRPVPPVIGHPDLSWHLAEQLILDEFDMTIVNEMPVDHGLTVPMSIMWGQRQAWPCPIIPLMVNVVQYPPPTGLRCYKLGQAIRRALHRFPPDLRIVIFGTGGLSHQLHGTRAGLINQDFDKTFMDNLSGDPEALTRIPHSTYMREAGSEAVELVMWLIMRGAMDDEVREVYRHYHVPVSNTAAGLIILENAK